MERSGVKGKYGVFEKQSKSWRVTERSGLDGSELGRDIHGMR